MKQLLRTTVLWLGQVASSRHAPRRLIGSALALIVAVAVVAVSTQDAHADRRDFTLNNNSSTVISRLYVSCSGCDNWGYDVLGTDVLYPGESTPITFPRPSSQCFYDIKVVNSRGNSAVLWGVNLCTTYTVTYS